MITTVTPRIVVYNDVPLPFNSMNISCSPVDAGRSQLLQRWTIGFTGVVPGVGGTFDTDRRDLREFRYKLLQPHKTLKVRDYPAGGGKEWLVVAPLAKGGTIEIDDRKVIMYDVAGGPFPSNFRIDRFMGSAFSYVFELTVTVAGYGSIEAEQYRFDAPILGMEADVTYGMDENHYSTRRAEGTIYLGRVLADGALGYLKHGSWGNTGDSKLDSLRLRQAVLKDNITKLMDEIYSVPDGMKRTEQNWSYSSDLTRVTFQFTDVEFYRALPWNITSGEATLSTAYSGVAFGAPVVQVLRGRFTAPKDVAKETIMARILDLASICNGLSMRIGRFVDTFQLEVSLFSNTIAFEIRSLVNFGSLPGVKGSFNPDDVLYIFGLGRRFGRELDKLSKENQSLTPKILGTAGLAGHPYSPDVAGTFEIEERVPRRQGYSRLEYSPEIGREMLIQSFEFEPTRADVLYEPGMVRFILGRSVSVVLPYESGEDESNKAVVINGVGTAWFYGYETFIFQDNPDNPFESPDRYLPMKVVNALDRYGRLSFPSQRTRLLAQPAPGALNRQLKAMHTIWTLKMYSQTVSQLQEIFSTRSDAIISAEVNKLLVVFKTTFHSLPGFLRELLGN